jgi:hypothetical protein
VDMEGVGDGAGDAELAVLARLADLAGWSPSGIIDRIGEYS